MTLELVTGSMFSGKTLELIRRVRSATAAGEQVCVAKPALDADQGWLVSLAGPRWPAGAIDGVGSIDRIAAGATVVAVDEAQFLGSPEVRSLQRLGDDGVRVIAAGLDLDFRGNPFPSVELLAAGAESVTKLTAVCVRCGAVATRSQRLLDGRPAPTTTPTILLGRDELYEPRCVECHEVP